MSMNVTCCIFKWLECPIYNTSLRWALCNAYLDINGACNLGVGGHAYIVVGCHCDINNVDIMSSLDCALRFVDVHVE